MRRRKRMHDEEKIRNFEKWCREAGIALHPQVGQVTSFVQPSTSACACTQLYIGYRGSCAEIGVIATDYISKGTKLAVIPQRALLTATNSCIRSAILHDKIFRRQLKTMNSWVPLLLALLAEYDQKATSACVCCVCCIVLSPCSPQVIGTRTCPWFQVRMPLVLYFSGLGGREGDC